MILYLRKFLHNKNIILSKYISCLAFIMLISGCTPSQKKAQRIDMLKVLERDYKINLEKEKKIEDKSQIKEEDIYLDRSVGKINYIGLLVPLTGQFSGIGKNVLDSVMLALFSSGFQRVRVLPFDTKGTSDGARNAAQDAIDAKVDVVLGPIFALETNAIKNMLQIAGITIISLSNDATIASEGVYVFGIPPEALAINVLSFVSQKGKKNIGLILPSNEYGYKIGTAIKKEMESMNLFNIVTEYYPRNRDLFKAVANRVLFSRSKSYKIKEDGSLYNFNRRNRSEREKDEENHTIDLPVVKKKMDVLYIDAKGTDLEKLMIEIDSIGLNAGDVEIFISDIITSWSSRINYRMEGVMFPSVASFNIQSAELKFANQFGVTPSRIGLLAYDAISTIIYLVNKDKAITKRLNNSTGYSGILGDFRFSKKGIVQRRFGIYTISNGKPYLVYTAPNFI